MKQTISFRMDEDVREYLKDKRNRSELINRALRAYISIAQQEEMKERAYEAILDLLIGMEAVSTETFGLRLGNRARQLKKELFGGDSDGKIEQRRI